MGDAGHGSARFHDLDALRAAAMFLGVVYHAALASYFLGGHGWPTSSGAIGSGLDWLVHALHTFRLPLFFLLSGFFGALVVSRRGPASWGRDRLRRLGLPLVIGVATVTPLGGLMFQWAAAVRTGSVWQPDFAGAFGAGLLHLWFLWYLLLLCGLAVGLRRLAARPPRLFGAMLEHRARALLLALPAAALMYPGHFWGAETPTSVVPTLMLPFYGLFFAAGWAIQSRRHLLAQLRRRWGLQLLLAAACTVVIEVVLSRRAELTGTGRQLAEVGTLVLTGLAAWWAIGGLLGVAHRLFAGGHPAVRYAADAAYWTYLIHVPIVFACANVLHLAGLPLLVCIVLAIVITTLLCVASYALWIRHRSIGRFLHGARPRLRAELQPAAA
jgi:peptidoglycan/LPS O-acetylase OafA/YrhL